MLQKLNKILFRNQKGFSLIELMIAVAILALVAVGLFQAFSVAFQSINDSKDRTIATNYAQQILEDYKNMPFEKIESFQGIIEGTKFSQNVVELPSADGLKEVFVEITWLDRNSNNKNITAQTKIYDSQGIAQAGTTPAGIVIYADRYNLLPGTDERALPSHIYAEIIDKNGDIVTDWAERNIYFNIESVIKLDGESVVDNTYLGDLRDFSVHPVNGVADTYFDQYSTEEREGFVKIKASLTIEGVELYDVLNLKVTNDAVAIIVETDKDAISTEGGAEGTANLTATIVDAVGDVVETERDISFNIFSGPGFLNNFVPNNSDGIATISLTAGDTPGTTVIMATSSSLLEPGVVEVQIIDPEMNDISVEAVSQTIVQQDSTEIIAYLTNYMGEPVSGEIINFAIDNTFLGSLSSESGTTNSSGEAVTTLTMDYGGTAIITASWEAEDNTVVSDTVSVVCRNHNLYVSANPLTITEGSFTTIFAELTDAFGNHVEGEIINFIILEGSGYFNNNSDITDVDGIASATLNIDSEGVTIVEANWQGDPIVVLGDAEVECTSAPIYQVDINAEKTIISVGESLEITATVTENGISVGSGFEVTFSLDDYTNARLDGQSSQVKVDTVEGIATVNLSGLAAGESVIVTAEAGGANDIITISCEPPEIVIELADPPDLKLAGRKKDLYFDITISGGNVDLEKMNVSWEAGNGEKLKLVYINDTEVYSNNQGAVNGTNISFNIDPFYYSLINGNIYTIKMQFDNQVKKKNWTISFFAPYTENIISTITFYLHN